MNEDLRKIAGQLHDLRFRIKDMANGNDAVGRWLGLVASEIEDIEAAVVILSEREEHGKEKQ